MNVPTFLTLIRLVGAVLIMPPLLASALPRKTTISSAVTVVVFGLLALTDFFDGYIARLWHQQTDIGATLDPLADKFLVIMALIPLIAAQRVMPSVGLVIIGRELLVTTLRELALLHSFTIPVVLAGKVKTALQLMYIALVIWNNRSTTCTMARYIEHILALITIFFTIYSAILYYHAYIHAYVV